TTCCGRSSASCRPPLATTRAPPRTTARPSAARARRLSAAFWKARSRRSPARHRNARDRGAMSILVSVDCLEGDSRRWPRSTTRKKEQNHASRDDQGAEPQQEREEGADQGN